MRQFSELSNVIIIAAASQNETANNFQKLQTLYCVPVRSFCEETSSSTSRLSDDNDDDDDAAEYLHPTDSCARLGRLRDLRLADGSSRLTTSTSAISFMF